MRAAPRPFSASSGEMQTRIAQWEIERLLRIAKQVVADEEREARVAACQCLRCWYCRRDTITGQAMTMWACGLCAKETMHSNTGVPRLCKACAATHNLCAECGGDVNGNIERREWPKPTS